MKEHNDLTTLSKDILDTAISKGFFDTTGHEHFHRMIAFIHSEVSEVWTAKRTDNGKLGEELADVMILLLCLAEMEKVDVFAEVLKKHEINKQRPIRHGKLF